MKQTACACRSESIDVSFAENAFGLNEIARLDYIYQDITDDGSPPASFFDIEPLLGRPGVEVVKVGKDKKPQGFFLLTQLNSITWQFHTALTLELRGPDAKKSVESMFDLMFTSTSAKKLVTFVPTFNRKAAMFAVTCGMSREGLLTSSFLKNNRLYDQVIFSIQRG